jgi:processing peptidase subunit beta
MVTKEDVLAVADKYFYDRDFAMAAFGPIYGLPDYNQIRNLTFSKFR